MSAAEQDKVMMYIEENRKWLQQCILLRRTLHEQAELALREEKTKECLKSFLRTETDFEVVDQGAWFYAVKAGKGSGGIAFRAEMDALPIREKEKTVSHRCGHDGHMAAVCGIALAMKGIQPERTVYLVFQPAEETGQGGAMCASSLKEHLDIQEIYACHNRSGFPERSVWCREGLTQPASEGMRICFTGMTSHASEPEKGRNPAAAISELVLFSLGKNRREPLILSTVTGIQNGEGDFGISPGYGELCLTLRAERESDLRAVESAIQEKAESLAERDGLLCRMEICDIFPETKNDSTCAQKVRRAAEELNLQIAEEPSFWRASEDFGYYTKQIPGAMFYVGNGTEYPALHTDQYEYNDRILETVVSVFLKLIPMSV